MQFHFPQAGLGSAPASIFDLMWGSIVTIVQGNGLVFCHDLVAEITHEEHARVMAKAMRDAHRDQTQEAWQQPKHDDDKAPLERRGRGYILMPHSTKPAFRIEYSFTMVAVDEATSTNFGRWSINLFKEAEEIACESVGGCVIKEAGEFEEFCDTLFLSCNQLAGQFGVEPPNMPPQGYNPAMGGPHGHFPGQH